MTDPGYVHYVMIIDRSGSMRTIKDDTQGGIRAFVAKQLEGVDASKRTVSFYQFDTVHDKLLDFEPLARAADYELSPRGGTALLDACGQAVTEVGEKLAALPEDRRPGHVRVIIATDGQENSSKKYTRAQVRELISRQQDAYDWKFTYLGANQDSFTEAGSIGIAAPSVLSYVSTSRSVVQTWDMAAASVSASTAPSALGIFYTDYQRQQAAG